MVVPQMLSLQPQHAQGHKVMERLRRALGDVRRRHCRPLLGAAEAAGVRRMREMLRL
uniref:Uncharacterized protein n=1 Tax=Oryza sativa subsp. japonica TaxID=39947 RepID=Q2QXX0_ORYSJ|nr:hypothetical protein LOC_Os12g04630 [Oryza sativa Japonica Group]